jgi:RND family efflux transporter MFP subunit
MPLRAPLARHFLRLLLVLALLPNAAAGAQSPPPSPVRFTEAREYAVRPTVKLPGTVEARTRSVVASEVAGLVVEVPVREGDRVESRAVLARLRRDVLDLQLRALEGQLKEAEARLGQARRRLERAVELFRDRVATEQQLDDARTDAEAAEGRVDAIQADIARTRDRISRSSIRAPFAGTVVARHLEVGEWVEAGGEVAELVDLDDLEVAVDAPEDYYRQIRLGDPAEVRFAAAPGLELTGGVRAVVPKAYSQARTFPVKVRIGNPEGRIGVGMLAEVSFAAGEPRPAVIVPKDAVVSRGPERFVLLIDEEDKVRQVPVETGAAVGSWIAVKGPVAPGARAITRGNERLFPGQPVTVLPKRK